MHQVCFITGASSGFGATPAEATAIEGVAATTPSGGPSRATRYRCPLEGNRGVAQYGLLKRMHKLLCLLQICMHLNQKRSRAAAPAVGTAFCAK